MSAPGFGRCFSVPVVRTPDVERREAPAASADLKPEAVGVGGVATE
jgi:hypothetical protein